MPKRKTKGVGARRAQPILPEGNEGNALTQDERIQKLALFLKDFHVKVEDKLKKMREDRNETISKVEVLFSSYMMQIPMELLDMKITDFLACGGTVEKALDHQLDSSEDDVSEALGSFLKKSATKKTALRARRAGGFEAITEEGEEENVPPSTQRATRQRKTKAPTKTTMAPPMSKSRLRTPAPITLASAGWDTPLITPKFDPRLPRTPPGVRAPHVGERLISLNGSPITVIKKAGTKQTTIAGTGIDITYNVRENFSMADMKKALNHMHSLLQEHVDREENNHS